MTTSDLRQWVEGISDGSIDVPLGDVLDVMRNLLDELDELHGKDGANKPQFHMTKEDAQYWIDVAAPPKLYEIFGSTFPNVFYVSFLRRMCHHGDRRLGEMGFTAELSAVSAHKNLYKVTWTPPKNAII